MENFNAQTLAIISALQMEGFHARNAADGAAGKKHEIEGVVVAHISNSAQYVCPVYSDRQFDLNPIQLREGKLMVSKEIVGTVDNVGYKWFETNDAGFAGSLVAFMGPEESLKKERTAPPMPPAPVVEATEVSETVKVVEVAKDGSKTTTEVSSTVTEKKEGEQPAPGDKA